MEVTVEASSDSRTPAAQLRAKPDPLQKLGKVEVDRLSVVYKASNGPRAALHDVSVTLAAGEFLTVVGASGCGKSTLLKAIAGLVRPTTGRVTVDGKTVDGPGADRAVVFQDDAVFPWMTVERNVAFSQVVRKQAKEHVQRSVDLYLKLVGLDGHRKAWPRELSGGMRKRVDIARAFAAESTVLLLDEPFGTLDILTKERLQEDLRRLWTIQPRTILFITHDLEEALYLGQRVILMRPGYIAEELRPSFPSDRTVSIKTESEFVETRRELKSRMSVWSE